MSASKRRFNKKIRRRKKVKLQIHINAFDKLYTQDNKSVTSIHNIELENTDCQSYTFLKYFIIQIFLFFLLIFPVIVILLNPETIIFKYREYKIGEYLTIDNSNWYVIKDSDTLDDSLVLLSETDLDLNNDGKLDKKDKIDFASINDVFENDIKNRFNNKKIKKVRLLTSDEYILAREKMNFGYDWERENFLAGESKGKWWLNTEKYGKVLSVNVNGTYNMNEQNDKNFIRPVIEILKFNIN